MNKSKLALAVALIAVVATVSLLSITDVRAVIKDQFEIDVGATSGTDFAKRAYYHGDDPSAGGPRDDWATSAPIPTAGTNQDGTGTNNDGFLDCQNPGAGPTQPVFLACNSDVTTDPNTGSALATCYGSRVVANPAIIGQPVFMCDGNSGSDTTQTELNIVSSFSGCSDQKTNDDQWCIKQSGVLNNPAKSDETHGYTVVNRTGLTNCPSDSFVVGGYERLGNEGSVFAGFIFAQKAPANIPSGSDAIMSFADQGDGQGTRRSIGDILVLLNQNGSDVEMFVSVAVADFNGDGVPDFPEPVGPVTAGANECGSFADINSNSVLAPPWLGNFCDPTEAPVGGGTGLVGTSNNQCKVVGNTPPPCTAIPPCPAGGNLVPDQDFVEFALDLTAEGVVTDPCQLTTVIMTTRSSNEFTADLKDVAIAPIPQFCDIEVVKTGDELSKVGDSVDYTITVSNPGDNILFKDDISDTLLGAITVNGVNQANPLITSNTCGASLAPNASCTITATRTVLPGDPDPLPNTVTVVYNSKQALNGFSLNDTDDHSVNLFQPSITLVKTGDTLSKIGDTADYTITLNNTSSADTPTLSCTITDALLGVNKNVNVAAGANNVTNVSRVVQQGDPDPLPNTASATCSPAGFPNVLNASDGHSVNLFQPSITLSKTGDTISKVGDSVNYTITVTNTSSADTPTLSCTITDSLLGLNKNVNLASGASDVTNTSRVVVQGDPDPLVNTASVTCSPAGFPNVLTANDNHSVNLFQPSITINKTGDALSKVGDNVDYTITVTNTSSADTPQLSCTITDPLLGLNKNVNLNPGQNNVTNVSRTVLQGDPDPVVNTASAACSPAGFPNVLNASDGHSVNLFQPSITLVKTGDGLSKVGDSVDYTITLTNTSSADTPQLICTVTDALLGINKNVNLNPGQNNVTNASRTVLQGDPDPLLNTAGAQCSPTGFANILTASDGHSVNLFQPSITLVKTGDESSKVGDPVNYTITLTNTSSADTPTLSCTVTDPLLEINKNVNLAPGANDVTNDSRVVQANDPDPLVNTASAACSPAGFPNVLNASDNHSVNLFGPSITFVKTGDTLSKIGDSVNYTITLTNTSSADTPDLECTITDALLGIDKDVTLASGASNVTNASRVVQPGDPDPVVNTASVVCTVDGFPNVLNASDGHSVNLFQPSITIDKTGDTLSKVGDGVDYTITLTNTSSADTPQLSCTITDALLGVNKNVNLNPGQNNVTNASRTVQQGDPDPVLNTASASCSPAGFPNVLNASDGHSVNLFQPSITLVKTGDTLSKIGDNVDYTITLTNTSSADTPQLSCTIVDALLGINKNVNLNPGQNNVTNASRTVLQGDPDPLVNTAGAQCSPAGFPNILTANDNHTVNLFQPSITLVKAGDESSKVGDPVNYTITLTNTSSADTPTLSCTVTDPLLEINKNVNLAPGANDVTNDSRVVQANDPDPLVNTASAACSPAGFPNVLNANDSHSVNLFGPSITFVKTGDTLSKVGDSVNYTITLTNTSSADTPDLECTITDALLGIDKDVTLASGASNVTNASRVVQPGDPDPVVNTASVVCTVDGFPNVLNASDGHSVNLFQPSITIDKTGDTLSKAGDSVDYTITLTNTSSADTPTLSCTVVDQLLGINKNVNLTPGQSNVTNASRTVLQGDPDPLVNTAGAQCSPAGFPNILTANDNHTVNLFQPSIMIDKTGDTLSKVGDSVDYTITLTNTSSADTPQLSCTVVDQLLGINKNVNLNPGQSDVTNASRTVQPGDADPLPNTASATCSPAGFPNVLNASDGHSVNLFQPSITLSKTGDELSKVGDSVNYTITLTNTSSADTPNLSCTITDALLGVDKNVNLAPGANDVTNASRTVQAGDPDPLPNTASVTCSPAEFPNVLALSASHNVNLFQPSITLDKTGDELSKIGDPVDYTITLNNTSSNDTPTLTCTITDPIAGVNETFDVEAGAQHVIIVQDFVIPQDASDPFLNAASASCSPAGFPNILTSADGHSVNLFQPGVEVTKECDDFAKAPQTDDDAAGLDDSDDIRCIIEITNLSSEDSPDLVNGTISDTLCGDLLGEGNGKCTIVETTCTDTLATGDSCQITYDYLKENVEDTPDPLVNTVVVHYNPEGFPNSIDANASDTIDVLHPDLTVVKDCVTPTVQLNGTATFSITITNTGDTELIITTNESAKPGPFALDVDEAVKFDVTMPASQAPTAVNTVEVTATLPEATGLTNELNRTAEDACNVATPSPTPAVLPVALPPTGGAVGLSGSAPWLPLLIGAILLIVTAGVSAQVVRIRRDE